MYGFDELKESLKNKVNEMNLSNIAVNNELKRSLEVKGIKSSYLLVYPCKIASGGDMMVCQPYIEAMGYGTPVLTTNVSSIPEIIKWSKWIHC